MKNTFATLLKRMNAISIKIVGLLFLLMFAFNFLIEKMPAKWAPSGEKILVRDLRSIEISPISTLTKPKPLPPAVKQIFIHQKTEKENLTISSKDSLFQKKLPLVDSKKSKFSPATIHASTPISAKKTEQPLLIMAEEMPRFPGCDVAKIPQEEMQKCAEQKMLKYIRQNIDYPQTAMSQGIQGVVYIQFVVEKNGQISNVKIMRDIGGDCGEEAKRVVIAMPDWIPGKQGGNPRRVQFNLPVKFKL